VSNSDELEYGDGSKITMLAQVDESGIWHRIPADRRPLALFFWVTGACKSMRTSHKGWLPSWALDQISVGFAPGAVAQAVTDLEAVGLVKREDGGVQFNDWYEYADEINGQLCVLL
jgi:hypothetical protein